MGVKKRAPDIAEVFFRAAIAISSCTVIAAANETQTVNIDPATRHVFQGFGTSTVHHFQPESDWFARLSDSTRQELVRVLFSPDETNCNIVRIWAHDEYGGKLVADRHRLFVNEVKKVQPDATFLFAPCPFEKVGHIANLQLHASVYAQQMKDMRDLGVSVQVTGICNEPNVHGRLRPDEIGDMVKLFRSEMDKRGLNDIKIIAPENATVDDNFYAGVTDVLNDPEALKALDGFASHSYNCGASIKAWELTHETAKTYWQTESSNTDPCGLNDDNVATRAACTMLGDVNMVVTHWIYFIDYYNATGMALFLKSGSGATPMLQYFYFRQISEAVHPGAKIHFCTAEEPLPMTEMSWVYGQKSAIYAAAAENPDGTWGICICNATGIAGSTTHMIFYPAATFDVTVRSEDLAAEPEIPFRVFKSNSSVRIEEQPQKAIMRSGELTITVQPKELITLRSDPLVSVQGQGRPAARELRAVSGAAFNIVSPRTNNAAIRLPLQALVGREELAVYDLTGRLVRTIALPDASGADSSIRWDGKDDRGNPVPPGVYAARPR